MASHTSGPWSIGEAQFGAQVMVFAGEREVADCGHNFSDCGNEEDRANARLIASAPELLQALETLLAEHIGYAGDGSEDHECCVCKMARAAIRKARGV